MTSEQLSALRSERDKILEAMAASDAKVAHLSDSKWLKLERRLDSINTILAEHKSKHA